MRRDTYDTGDTFGFYTEDSKHTSNYHEKVKAGEILPINYYKWTRTDGRSPFDDTYAGIRTERDAAGWNSFNTQIGSGVSTLSGKVARIPTIAGVRNIAENRILNCARDIEIDLGIALGEYRETANFIANTMKKTAGGLRELRRGNASRALRILRSSNQGSSLRGVGKINLKDPNRKIDRFKPGQELAQVADAASDTHLAIEFGLKPILSDVYDAMVLLDKDLNSPDNPVFTCRSSYKEEVSGALVASGSQYYHTSRIEGNIRCSCKLEYIVDNPITATLGSVGLGNPIATAWEVLPLSFVVDWFVPVGEYLLNVFPPPGLKVVRGYSYVKAKGTYKRTHTRWSASPSWNTELDSWSEYKERKPWNQFPNYHVKIPNISLEKGKIMSGIALLWSIFS